MRIVQAVFGVFHHFELARELERRGHLSVIYSTFPWRRLRREGLVRSKVQMFPWLHTSDIMLGKTGFENPWVYDQIRYANALAYDAWTSRRIPPCDAFIAISGAGLKTGKLIQSRGGRFICDRGSTHQRVQAQIVSEEYRRWKVDLRITDPRAIAREEKIYDLADAITVPSRFAARTFIDSGIPASKVNVIPYGVRLERFRRTGEPIPGRFDVLFAGSVSLRKGFPYLLQAFAQLRHSSKRLRVAGIINPDIRAVLKTLPQENVEFLGTVPQERLAELMSTSHVMVLPSIEEGLALVQGQALACGCPVISTVATGGEDLFSDEIEGFILPIRDPEAILDRMQRLADDPALQQQMSEAALRRVSSLGGWQRYGDLWEQLLYQLTGRMQMSENSVAI